MEWKLILQIVGVLLGLLYLWLEYKVSIWLWAVGIVMPLVHGTLYYQAGLYADSSMQVYYVLAGLYGWFVWHNAPKKQHAPTRISHTPLRIVPMLAGVCIAVHAALYFVLSHFTDSTVPFWDSLTTALCVVAMWMLSRKYTEQWLVWLAVDLITVGLYWYKELPLTAGLYALYSALAAVGYVRWRRRMREQQEPPLQSQPSGLHN